MEQVITDHLRDLFNPAAVIIHSSRAVGREREHSDWDLFLLYTESHELPKDGRLIWQGQNIEHSHHRVPAADIEAEFGVKLQFGRVLFETEKIGTSLVDEAKKYYAQPAGWSELNNHNHSLWMRGRIDGMRDTTADPLIFERYASDFYARITNYWYWAIHDTYPKPIYFALEEIAEQDPSYFALIETFVSGSNEEKVAAAEQIFVRCFGERA